ncbi:translation initiation factor IF-1 [Roseimicrobium sp. ORNL1]|uniref:translation initiation factor IF-1 n=1 Tax=Roseimicrobium sp. ORNL1 TaxID=2711231 RepID=UPI0031BB5251
MSSPFRPTLHSSELSSPAGAHFGPEQATRQPHRGGGGRGRGGSGGRGRGGPMGGGRFGRPGPEEPTNPEDAVEVEGTVAAVLAGTMFRVKLRNGHMVLAHISGKMRKRFIRLVIGDEVKLEMSPYDPDKARIVYRL